MAPAPDDTPPHGTARVEDHPKVELPPNRAVHVGPQASWGSGVSSLSDDGMAAYRGRYEQQQ